MGDYVFLEGGFWRVDDMRNTGGGSARVLILRGFGPWIMTVPREVYRPITPNHA
ncbi:hypothetical protein [Streptomyces sp. NPDC051162]|uniref:hypothetical protein n=1 Tax=Streptomyces sp. NPDC051162 TaxID=3154747 RepID=UPI00342C50ED